MNKFRFIMLFPQARRQPKKYFNWLKLVLSTLLNKLARVTVAEEVWTEKRASEREGTVRKKSNFMMIFKGNI